jgi:hypothetical protein
MKVIVLGVLMGAGLVWALSGVTGQGAAFGQRAGDYGSQVSSDLVTMMTPVGDRQVVTVIDPKSRVMGVYSIDHKSGEITLKSVRNLTWDLQMTGHNTGSPAPQEIRELLQQITPRR